MENLLIRKIDIEDADDLSRIQAEITKSAQRIDFRQIIKRQLRKNEDASFAFAEK